MSMWLSQEWLDQMRAMYAALPTRRGATVKMQYKVHSVPAEAGVADIDYYWIIVDGKLQEARLGVLEDAEVTLTQTYADAKLIQEGRLGFNDAFMRGKTKVTGSMAKLMAWLPVDNSPEFRSLQPDLRAITEYPTS